MLIVTTTEDCDKITIINGNGSNDLLFEWTYGSDFDDVLTNLEKLFNGDGIAYMVEQEEWEPLICGVCSGSGESAYPDTTCYSCKGSGTERKED